MHITSGKMDIEGGEKEERRRCRRQEAGGSRQEAAGSRQQAAERREGTDQKGQKAKI